MNHLINLSEFTVNDYKCTTMTWLQRESWQQKSKGYFVVCVKSISFSHGKRYFTFSMKGDVCTHAGCYFLLHVSVLDTIGKRLRLKG